MSTKSTLLPNGDLVVPASEPQGSFQTTDTRVVKTDDPEYPKHYAAHQEQEKSAGGLGVFGWFCALLLPPLGVLIGVVLLAQKKNGGVAILIVSAIVWMIGFALLAGASSF